MAQQGVRNAVETPVRRTRSPRLPVAKTSNEAPSYERSRMTINDPEEFLNFMRGYPNPQGVTLFLYRLKPKIDLTLIGLEETNIQKGPIADLPLWGVDAIGEKFGRGLYNARVTDSNRPEGQKQVIQTCQYRIDGEKAPVYDVRTLVLSHAENIDEVNRLIAAGTLVRDASGSPRLKTAADIPVSSAPVAAAAPVDVSATQTLHQIALEAFKQSRQSPSEAIKDFIAISQSLHPPAPALSVDQIVEAVVTRLGGTPRGAAADPFAQWERVQGFIDRAAGVAAAGISVANPAAPAGDAGASWAPYVAPILQEVRSLWPEILNGLMMLRDRRGAAQPPAAAEQNGVLHMLPMDKRIETIFKAGFESMRRGITGADFAAWLCLSGEFPGGLEAFNVLKPAGAAGLVTMARMNPQGARIVDDAQIKPQLDLFLASFFSFDPTAPPAGAGV
jgi:hypothetical protein